jgi:cephalosporin hydroxylase
MRITIDDDSETVVVEDAGERSEVALYSDKAFEILSRWSVNIGWSRRYSYGFSWMGRPIIQLPDDIIRIQEVIWNVQPTVIIETGVAHGGSLILYASLFEAMGRGRVIGVDIEIRPHNRSAIETHSLAGRITLIEGSSTDAATLEAVRVRLKPDDRVLVILDSDHSRRHVAAELEAYAPMVSTDSYIVATDGIMRDLVGAPGVPAAWADDNPSVAAEQFASGRDDFVLEVPPRGFSETSLAALTYWPSAYLRRVR